MKEVNTFIKQYYDLLFHSEPRLLLVNWISFFRVLTFPVLMVLAFTAQWDYFKWLIGIAFFTDMLDGFLARKLKASSELGAKLDSIGDDLTILAGLVGMVIHSPDFILEQIFLIGLMLGLFVIEMIYAVKKYGKPSSLHTYLAKLAALCQGFFFISFFFFEEPLYWLFYTTVAVTLADLLEEIVIVYLLPKWKTNVKGLFWVLRKRGPLTS